MKASCIIPGLLPGTNIIVLLNLSIIVTDYRNNPRTFSPWRRDLFLTLNIFSCGAHGGGGHPGTDGAIPGSLVNRLDVSVLQSEFGKSFLNDLTDLSAELGGHRTVQVDVQTFRLGRGDLD